MRRPITSSLHGLLDYPAGILLIVSPWLFGFAFAADENAALAATLIPVIIGLMIIGQSLITDYELSIFNLLPLRLHLGMDVGVGAFLAASPFIFGFTDPDLFPQPGGNTWIFHVVMGVGLIASGLLTRPERGARRGETMRALDPNAPAFKDEGGERSGRFTQTEEFPARGQSGPDDVDVAHTASEHQSGRNTTTGR